MVKFDIKKFEFGLFGVYRSRRNKNVEIKLPAIKMIAVHCGK